MKRMNNYMLPLFILVLSIPLIAMILGRTGEILPSENRLAHAWPDVPSDLADLKSWPGEIEAWFADRYGFREKLIDRWRDVKNKLDGRQSHRVYQGRDGWLFLTDEAVFTQHTGQRLDRDRVENYLKTLARYETAARQHGVAFSAMVSPNKHTIYNEFINEGFRNEGQETELDVTVALAADRNLPLLDVRPALIETGQTWKTFWKGDTHWNQLGAAVAFDQVALSWGRADWLVLPEARVTLKDGVPSPGDLLRFMGLSNQTEDGVPVLESQVLHNTRPAEEKALDGYRGDLSHDLHYSGEGPTVLIIGDSFTQHPFKPFLDQSAARVIWLHHRNGDLVLPDLAALQVDYFFFQTAERFLGYWTWRAP